MPRKKKATEIRNMTGPDKARAMKIAAQNRHEVYRQSQAPYLNALKRLKRVKEALDV